MTRRRTGRLIAAAALVVSLAACSASTTSDALDRPNGDAITTEADGALEPDAAQPDPGPYAEPPGPRIALWAEDGLTVERDRCDEPVRIGREFALRRDGVGVVLPGWETGWWLDDAQLSRLGAVADDVTVGNWGATYAHGQIGLTASLRLDDACDPAVVVRGQLRWSDGRPVVRDPYFGSDEPVLEFADDDAGRALRALLEDESDG